MWCIASEINDSHEVSGKRMCPPPPYSICTTHGPYHWPHIHTLGTHFHTLSPYLNTMDLTCIWAQSSNHITHNVKSTPHNSPAYSEPIAQLHVTCLFWTENSAPCNPHWHPQLSTMWLTCIFQVQHPVPLESITQQHINTHYWYDISPPCNSHTLSPQSNTMHNQSTPPPHSTMLTHTTETKVQHHVNSTAQSETTAQHYIHLTAHSQPISQQCLCAHIHHTTY